MLKSIRHTGIIVEDLPQALELYVQMLGMNPVAKGRIKGKTCKKYFGRYGNFDLEFIKLSTSDGDILELYYFHKFPSKYKNCLRHVAFEVDDVDEIHDIFEEEGVPLTKPFLDDEKKHKLFFAFDKDWNLMEFVEVL